MFLLWACFRLDANVEVFLILDYYGHRRLKAEKLPRNQKMLLFRRTPPSVVYVVYSGHELKHTFELNSYLAKVSGISLNFKRNGTKLMTPMVVIAQHTFELGSYLDIMTLRVNCNKKIKK